MRAPHDDAVFGDGSIYTEIQDVVAGGPGFVAVGVRHGGFSGTLPFAQEILTGSFRGLLPGRSQGVIWTSRDGLVWTRVPEERVPETGREGARLYAVATGGSGLVAVGFRDVAGQVDPVVWTSPDGETWSAAADLEQTLQATGRQAMFDVIEGGPGLVAAGGDGFSEGADAVIWTSP